MSLTFLTPLAALVAVVAVVPLAAAAAGARRAGRVRRALRLGDAPRDAVSPLLLAAVPVLLALAAAQPALTRDVTHRTRTDAAAYVVLDVTRSMLASQAPGAPSRLQRAKAAAIDLRGQVPDVPFGVATLTDRVVPLLFPTGNGAAFDSTVRHAVRVDGPPPIQLAPNATDFSALGSLGTDSFFAPSTRRRVVVLLTDGESEPFDANDLAGLSGTSVDVIRFWHRDERVFVLGKAEPAYRPDPASKATVEQLAAATGGDVFEESDVAGAAAAIRQAAGAGPTTGAVVTTHRMPIGSWVALASIVPMALVFRRRLLVAP
jgi:hypothetical protein